MYRLRRMLQKILLREGVDLIPQGCRRSKLLLIVLRLLLVVGFGYYLVTYEAPDDVTLIVALDAKML